MLGKLLRMEPRAHHDVTAQRERASAALDALVVRALERKPEVLSPAMFARRVALLVVSQPTPRSLHAGSYAFGASLLAAVLVAVSLFALAPRAQASFTSFAFDLELVFLAQLALLAWWLAARRGGES